MKTIYVNGEELQAERIVKTNTDIIGYNGNNEVFSFRGISDFSQFQLAEGESYDIDLSPEARILALEEALLMFL
jgi:hypothetical protein